MEPRKKNTKLKLLYLLSVLRDLSDEEHVLNADDLLVELERRSGIQAERKSVYTDLKVLEEYGYDIIHVSSGKKGVFLGERNLELAEVRLLVDAVRSAGFISAEKSKKLTEHILSDLSIYDREFIEKSTYFDQTVKTTNNRVYYVINDLAEAIRKNKKVRLSYYKYRTQPGEKPRREAWKFTLSPYALIWANDRYYAICNNERHDNFMQIRVERITGVEILDEPIRDCAEFSSYVNGFDVADFAAKNFNGFSGKPVTVKLLCGNELLDEVKDRFGENIAIRYQEENRFVTQVQASVSTGFLNWVNQFGDKMLVLSPEELKESLLHRAKATLTLYESLEANS